MKKYEYKFVKFDNKLGINYKKKLYEYEKEWNLLGKDGWKFCKEGNDCVIFIREIEN